MRNHRAAIAFLSCLTLMQAQQPQQPAAPGNMPKFTSSTQLVIETVSVRDKDGKPIEGLTAKDFTVTENGVPQTISICEFQKLDEKELGLTVRDAEPAAATAAPAAPAVKPEEKPKDPTAAPAIAGAAQGEIKYRDRRLLVIYFDMSGMPVPDQLRALSAARTFITKQMQKADLLAIMKFEGGSVRVMQDFTDQRDTLLTVVDKMIAAEGQGFDETDPDTAADTGAAFGQNDSEFNLFNTDRQLSALQTAVKMLGTLSEKKALMYFASGVNLNGVDNQAQMRATVNSAIKANVSLFPIDARGLVAQPPMGDATKGSQGGVGMYSGAGAMAVMSGFQRSQDTMYALAADTGGKALLDVNDLTVGMQTAQKALSSYYILGYYTTNTNLDGKFRKVVVSLKELSAKLDYRSGYFGGKTFAKFTTSDKERQLEDALMLGDPITDLTIQMEVNYFQLNRAEYYVPVVMKIPGSELALARRGGAEHTVIDFIGEIKDEYGTTVQNIRDKVDIKLSGETAAELVKVPIQYDSGYTLLPGAYTIKVLARDDETGRIGTYLSKFVIPNLNKEDKRVPISSVVLSSQRIDLRDALYTAGKDKAQAANPLVQEGQKLIPSVTRVFSKQRDMYVYLQAYEPGVEKVQPVVAYVTFYRGQAKAFETPPLPVTDGLDTRIKTVPLKFSISLAKLNPGRYNCQVTVIDPTTQKANYWQAPVMVAP